MFRLGISCVFLLIAGISLAIKLPLLFQAGMMAVSIAYLFTEQVRRMEMEILIPHSLVLAFNSGMVLGDAYYFVVFQQTSHPVDIIAGIKWLFTP